MQVALLGLMQSGKSTILSAISGKQIPPGGAMGIEEAIVAVPDERLDWLTKLYKPKKTVRATIDALDVPGFDFTSDHGRAAARRLDAVIPAGEDPEAFAEKFLREKVPTLQRPVPADLANAEALPLQM